MKYINLKKCGCVVCMGLASVILKDDCGDWNYCTKKDFGNRVVIDCNSISSSSAWVMEMSSLAPSYKTEFSA